MAHTDPLTGLANERTVGRILELELARAGRQGGEVSLAMFDVDDFRATNRDGGHEAGDDVLRRVAAVLAESVRLVDTVGRIGGDEFVLVAPGSAGTTVAHRVLEGIAALPAIAGRPSRSRPASPASRPTARTPRRSSRAATDALAQAREAGRGSVGGRGAAPRLGPSRARDAVASAGGSATPVEMIGIVGRRRARAGLEGQGQRRCPRLRSGARLAEGRGPGRPDREAAERHRRRRRRR